MLLGASVYGPSSLSVAFMPSGEWFAAVGEDGNLQFAGRVHGREDAPDAGNAHLLCASRRCLVILFPTPCCFLPTAVQIFDFILLLS